MRMKTLTSHDVWFENNLNFERLIVCDDKFTIKFWFCAKAKMNDSQIVKFRLIVKNFLIVKILNEKLNTNYRNCISTISEFSFALLLILILLLYFHWSLCWCYCCILNSIINASIESFRIFDFQQFVWFHIRKCKRYEIANVKIWKCENKTFRK